MARRSISTRLRNLATPADGGDPDGEPDTDPREGLTVPIFHSNPSASKKIFLDFDGHVVVGTSWNQYNNGNPIYAPAYSSDGNIFDFSSTELNRIEETWKRIAEDYAPFDVDVTTEEPPASLFTQGNQAIRVLFTTDRDEPQLGGTGNYWFGGAGGVAFLNSWSFNNDTPVWVFENNLGANAKNMAEAGSHEVGHALNLSHDGTSSVSYYSGHGGTGTTSWAPIMGVGYNRNVTQWSRGEYNNANNTQNDLAIITNPNRLPYRSDDHSSVITNAAAATPLVSVGSINVDVAGIIERADDVDVFRIDAFGTTSVNLNIDPFAIGPNLDIQATIYDSTGAIVATDNPTNRLDASFNLNLPAGTYTLVIDGVGFATPANGFSDYASLGQYNITGTIDFADPVPGGPQVTAAPVSNSAIGPTSVLITFDQPIDSTTVSTADVTSFTDPLGNDASGQITSITFPAVDQMQINFAPLVVDGAYQVTIGPQIFDFEGLAMDQNQNGTAGEAADAYSFSIEVEGDTAPGVGPSILAPPVLDDVNAPSSLTFTFDQPMDTESFDLLSDILVFEGPTASALLDLTGFTWVSSTMLRVDFETQTTAGPYVMVIGPDIRDLEGLSMAQPYVAQFQLTPDTTPGGPVIIQTPVLDNADAPSSLTFQFNQSLDQGSVSLLDVTLFEGPLGNDLTGSLTGISFPADDQIEVNFTTLSAVGSYSLRIGPDILDIEGLAMDQNQNGTAGEAADDYTFVFVIAAPAIPGDFNGDGVVNVTDIDLLCAAVNSGGNDLAFDLTSDGSVDMADMDELILNTIGTLYGDANLDFNVDTSDFNLWNDNKFTTGAGWAGGDFNCDGNTDTSDFNVWNTNKFQSGAALASVPRAVPMATLETRPAVAIGIAHFEPADSRSTPTLVGSATVGLRSEPFAARRTIRWGESHEEHASRADAFWARFA